MQRGLLKVVGDRPNQAEEQTGMKLSEASTHPKTEKWQNKRWYYFLKLLVCKL
jgi:hypothetical protein